MKLLLMFSLAIESGYLIGSTFPTEFGEPQRNIRQRRRPIPTTPKTGPGAKSDKTTSKGGVRCLGSTTAALTHSRTSQPDQLVGLTSQSSSTTPRPKPPVFVLSPQNPQRVNVHSPDFD